MSTIFIGMPVYNGMPFISEAIDSICKQSYPDWKLLISDNASEDKTQEICEKYVKLDSRIKYIRHIKNIGASNNFKFLLARADSEFFMWAAADDIWDKKFIEECVFLLQKNTNIGLAFCNISNIDSFGRIIRDYPSFKKYSGPPSFKLIFKYLMSPEILGKANIIYGIYRLKICKDTWNACPLSEKWGSDMCFVLGALSRSGLAIKDEVLFLKRIPRNTDKIDSVDKIVIINPRNHIFPFLDSISYFKNNLNAVKGTNYYLFTAFVMLIRIPRSFFVSIRDKLHKLIKSI